MSRSWTQEEVQNQFLTYLRIMVNYWNEQKDLSEKQKLEGLLFSFLSMLDGCASDLPSYEVIPAPHPEDKEFSIKEGENYYQPFELPKGTITVHGNSMLHELVFKKKTNV